MTRPINAEDVQPEATDWLWGERIARTELHFIAGRADTGKGLIAAKIAADVSQGRDPVTGRIVQKPGRVLYSAQEDSYGKMTRPRLEAAEARLQDGAIKLWRFTLPGQLKELADYVVKEEIDLIIIDPLASHLDRGVSRHSDNIRSVVHPLKDLLEATGAAAVVIDHALKRVGPNSDPLAAVGGSGSGFPAACRMGFLYGPDPEDPDKRILACVKSNIREKPLAMAWEIDTVELDVVTPYLDPDTQEPKLAHELHMIPTLMYEGEEYVDPIRLVATDRRRTGKPGRPADKQADACEWLTNYLYNSYVKTEGFPEYPPLGKTVFEDAQQRGMAERTLRRAADAMKIEKTARGGTNVRWKLPSDIIEMLTGAADPDAPEVAQEPIEEPALSALLDNGNVPGGEPEDWERNKAKADVPAEEPDAMDNEIAELLGRYNADGGEGDGAQA